MTLSYANNKGMDKPVCQCSLIIAFVVCCFVCIIPSFFFQYLKFADYLVYLAGQTSSSNTWAQTPTTGFFVTRRIYYQSNQYICLVA